MFKLFNVFLFLMCSMFVIADAACVPIPQIVEHPAKVLTYVIRTYHADTAFNTWEREAIDDAITKLNHQSNGLIQASVVYDIDWDRGPVSDLAKMESVHQIVRIKSDTPFVEKLDGARTDHNFTQGYTKVDFDFLNTPTKIYIVYDRAMWTKDVYTHVVLHELLHSVGVRHVDDSSSVMYWQTNIKRPQMCMNKTDMTGLCKVYHCDPLDLNYCE